MKNALERTLVKAREKLLSSVMNESQMSKDPVRSILRALGWDTFDVDSLGAAAGMAFREYPTDTDSANDAVFVNQAAVCVIESKKDSLRVAKQMTTPLSSVDIFATDFG